MPNVLSMFNNLNVYSNFHHSALDICKLNSTFETLLPTHGNDQCKAMEYGRHISPDFLRVFWKIFEII